MTLKTKLKRAEKKPESTVFSEPSPSTHALFIEKKHILFRPAKTAFTSMPLSVRSLGFYGVKEGWTDVDKTLDFIQLVWVIEGELETFADGKIWRISAGATSVLFPGDRLLVSAKKTTRHWWLTVDGPLASDIVRSMGFGRGAAHPGTCPEYLYRELCDEIKGITAAAQRRAGALAYKIFSFASGKEEGTASEGIADEAAELIRLRFSDPQLSVQTVAEKIGVNRSTLSRAFHRAHGMTVVDFLVARRVQEALSLLKETRLPIAEIARTCGFNDPAYFSRAIRQRTGTNPAAFRKW